MDPQFIRNYLTRLDLINEQLLTEVSRGLLYRSPGDRFIQGDPKNPTATITFVGVEYFPSNPGEYEDEESLNVALAKVKIEYPGIMFSNSQMSSTRAFAIITLNGPGPGQQTYACRFFKKISVDMTAAWKNNDIPGGWQLAKANALKSSYGLKPADLFPANVTFPNSLAVVSALDKLPKIKELMPGMQMLLGNKLPIFPGQKDMLGAIQDDLGEIIAPIALSQGLITDSGAEAAKRDLLNGAGWEGCKISFPTAKNNGLVDSYVYVGDVEIGISSKGKHGAKASIKNVQDGINLAREDSTPQHKTALAKYAKQIAAVERIGSETSKQFPITYGIELGLITSAAGDKINELIAAGAKSLNQVTMSAAIREEIEELIDRTNASTASLNYCVGYHALMVVARDVAAVINADPKFGEACLYFVNINPIIQIYLTAAAAGPDVKVTKLTSLYPPNFQGTILLDAGKGYYSSGVGGKMAFSYEPDKNAASNVANQEIKAAKINAQTTAKIKKVLEPHLNLRPLGSEDVGTHSDSPRLKKPSAPRARR